MNAVPDIGDEAPEQLAWVEGFPASGTRWKLTSATKLWTDRKLSFNEHVKFSGEGRVKGMQTVEDNDGSLLYCYVIEATDAELL